MKKIFWIIGTVLLVIIVLIIGTISYLRSQTGLELTPATLYPQGNVNVERGTQKLLATEEFELQTKDIIITNPDSSAKVALFNSIFVDIDSNTKVSLESLKKDNIQLNQEYGSTWSKVTKLFAVNNYNLQTPNSIASVRGTEFGTENNQTDTLNTLIDGVLEVNNGKDKLTLKNLGAIESSKEKLKETSIKNKEKVIEKINKISEELNKDRKRVLWKFLKNNKLLLKKFESDTQQKVDPAFVADLLGQFDRGELDIKELRQELKSYKMKEDIADYLEEIGRKIKEEKELLEKIKSLK